MEAPIYNQSGESKGKISIPKGIFDMPWNADLVHEVVRLMNSNSRPRVAHTKTRGEVRGGGKKPWQQKGTGRARHGSSRSPIWVGGGITHGPRNEKNFLRKINKKVKTKALLTILSRKFKDGEILFVDQLDFSTPKSKDARAMLMSLAKIKGYEKITTKPKNAALITTDTKSANIEKSFRNFGNVSVEELRNVNPISILNYKYLIVSSPEIAFKTLASKLDK